MIPMQKALSFIAQSWEFARTQPVLQRAAFLLILLPLIAMNLAATVMEDAIHTPDNAVVVLTGTIFLILCCVMLAWGSACILLIGGKLIGSKSGRSRTSLSAVAGEAKAFIVPLVLTNILRGIITLLWSLLLIVPGIIYAVRTILSSVIIVEEGVAYRPALHHSRDIVKGRTGRTFVTLLTMVIVLFVPVSIVDWIVAMLLPDTGTADVIISIVDAILSSVSVTLLTLSLILLYGYLRPSKGPVMGGGARK